MKPLSRFMWLRLVLPLGLLFVAGGIATVLNLQEPVLDSSARALLASDARNLETYETLNSLIPDVEWVLVVFEMEDVFSDRGAQLIARATRQLREVPGSVEVKSLTHSGRPVRSGVMGLDIVPFIPLRASPEEWDDLREFTTRYPLSRNVLVSDDGRYTVLLGIFERALPDHAARLQFKQDVQEAMDLFSDEVVSTHVLAFPFLEAEGVETLREDLTRYLLAASAALIVVLAITFRSLPAIAVIMLWQAIGLLGFRALFAWMDEPIDLYTGILFPLLAGLQLTFAVHYLTTLQRLARDLSPSRAARRTFAEVFPPSLLAALTTLLGLLSLRMSDMPTLSRFGDMGMRGVVIVFLVTFLVPAALAIGKGLWIRSEPNSAPGKAFPPALARGLWVITLLLCIPAAIGIQRIRTDIRALEFIPPDHPTRQSIERIDRDLGGINIFQIEIDSGRAGGLQTLPVLRFLDELRTRARELEEVSDAYAYSQLYQAMHHLWERSDDPEGPLPRNPAQVALYSRILNMTPLLFQETIVDAEARRSVFVLRTRDMPGSHYLALLENFLAEARERAPPGVTLEPVQGLHSFLEADRELVRTQLRTLGLGAVLISLLLMVLWWSPVQAAMVLAANAPALLAIFGLMGWLGIPLNSITVMVAALLIGISVDDGIHWISAYRRHRRNGLAPPPAARGALNEKARAMLCTSFILMFSLGLLGMMSFPPIAHFGGLCAFGLLIALLGSLFLLPSLVSWRKCSSGLANAARSLSV